MKTIYLLSILFMLVSTMLFAQRTEQFGRFTDSNGKTIIGTSMERGFERQIYIENLQVNTTDVIRIRITLPNSDAVSSFQSAANTKSTLQSGEITVLKLELDRKVLFQKILLSSVKVVSVTARDDSASIELETASFNQTYYTVDRNGNAKPVKN